MSNRVNYVDEVWEYDEEQDSLVVTFGDGSKAYRRNFLDNVRMSSMRWSNAAFNLSTTEDGLPQSPNEYGIISDYLWDWWDRCQFRDGIWIIKSGYISESFKLYKIGDDGRIYTRSVNNRTVRVDKLVTNQVVFTHPSFDGERCGIVTDNEIYTLVGEGRWYARCECEILSDQVMHIDTVAHEDIKRVYQERNRKFGTWLNERFQFDSRDFCAHCGSFIRDREHRSIMRWGETYNYCLACYEDLVHTCGHCGQETLADGTWVDELDMWVEYDCYDEALHEHGLAVCHSCDRTYEIEDDGDEDYCPTCSRDIHWNASEHRYNYVPPMRFTHVDKSATSVEQPGKRYIGCELEFEGGDVWAFRNTLFKRMQDCDCDKHMYFMHDGSLNDGIEMATVPIELDYALGDYPFDLIHKVAQQNGMKSHQTQTCGFHIHVNRASIPNFELTMAKVLLAFDKFYDQLLKFSRRAAKDRPEHWCAKPNANIQRSDTSRELRDKLCVAQDHYRAVNMLPRNTVEFRLWKGTHNPDTIRATIDFLSTLIDLCAELGLEELYDMEWEVFSEKVYERVKLDKTREYMVSRKVYVL